MLMSHWYGFLNILTFITTNWLIAVPRTYFSMHMTYLPLQNWHSVPADDWSQISVIQHGNWDGTRPMLHDQHMIYFHMSDANYCCQMLRDQLCAIVTGGFNVEGPPAWIAHNTQVWMWSGIEDTYHFLHECTSYVDIHQALFDEVKNVWKDSSNEGRPTLSVPLMLAPYSGFQLTTPQWHQIVSATFEYIKNSSRRF